MLACCHVVILLCCNVATSSCFTCRLNQRVCCIELWVYEINSQIYMIVSIQLDKQSLGRQSGHLPQSSKGRPLVRWWWPLDNKLPLWWVGTALGPLSWSLEGRHLAASHWLAWMGGCSHGPSTGRQEGEKGRPWVNTKCAYCIGSHTLLIINIMHITIVGVGNKNLGSPCTMCSSNI